MSVLLSFALALFLTTVTLPLCMRYAVRLGLLDAPGPSRKVHETVIPRSGGLAIVLGTLLAAALWLPPDPGYLPLAAAVLLVVLFGYLDDRFTLGSRQKFLGQCIAAVVFLAAYGSLLQLPLLPLDSVPAWILLGWTFIFLIGVTNAVNLSDGLDGLAAGNSLLSIVLLAVLAAEIGRVDYMVMAVAVAGGQLGFLRFNTHPARLFMGDSGSQFLGFTGAAIAVLILREESMPYSALLPVLIFGLPILDTLSVMAVRKLRGRPVFEADRSHLHHQLLALGLKHYEVVAVLYALQGSVVLMAYLLRQAPDLILLLAYGAFCASVLGGILACRLSGWRAHAREGQATERRNRWLRSEWYHRNTAKVLGGLVAALFLGGAVYAAGFSSGAVGAVADPALVTAALLGVAAIWFRQYPEFVGRMVTFVVTAFAVYGFLFALADRPNLGLAIDAYFMLLAVLLALAIRVTRKSQFHLDTQDYLVLFIVLVVPFLPIAQFDGLEVVRATLRGAVLLYACEYVVTKGGRSRWLLIGAGIASLAILGLSPRGDA